MLSGNRYPLSRYTALYWVSQKCHVFLSIKNAIKKFNQLHAEHPNSATTAIICIIFLNDQICKKMELTHTRSPERAISSEKCGKLLEYFNSETRVFRVKTIFYRLSVPPGRRYRCRQRLVAHKLAVIVAAIEMRYAVPMSLHAKGRPLGCESDKKDGREGAR